MNSFILIGDKAQRDAYIHKFISFHAIRPYYMKRFSEILKIADIRELKKKISIKIERAEKRLFVIEEEITLDAQNAFLKTLEESAPSVYFILCTQSKDSFLPTIISRCQIVQLAQNELIIDDESIQRKFARLNDHPKQSYELLYSLMSDFHFLAAKEDVELFLLSYRKFIITSILQKKFVKSFMIDSFTQLYSQIPLLKNNNINRRLTVEAVFFS